MSASGKKGTARNRKNVINISTGSIAVYASPRITSALDAILGDMSLYHGVRLTQVIEAVYLQGKKDGARTAFDATVEKINEAKKLVPHKNPGKPRKAR